MIKSGIKIFSLFAYLSFFNFLNCSFAENSSIITIENKFTPDVAFFDEEDKKMFLDQFEGKTILLSFWATWCGPCIEELPSLDILQKDFRKLPFEILAISEDFNGLKIARDHFTKYGIRHLKLFHDHKNELFKSMSVTGLPSSYLIDSNGKIKLLFKGYTKWHDDSIRAMLLSEIPGNPEMPKNSYITTSLNKKVASPVLVEGLVEEDSNKGKKEKGKEQGNNNQNQQNPQNANSPKNTTAENNKTENENKNQK